MPTLRRVQRTRPNIPPDPAKESNARSCAGLRSPLHHIRSHSVGSQRPVPVDNGDEVRLGLAPSFLICSAFFVSRLTDERLTAMALSALEDVAANCHAQRVPRTRSLAVVLAYLASRAQGRREPYDLFWRGLGTPRDRERWAYVNSALNGIYRAAGIKRDLRVVSRYEKYARDRLTQQSAESSQL